jgi:hypothetical protein
LHDGELHAAKTLVEHEGRMMPAYKKAAIMGGKAAGRSTVTQLVITITHGAEMMNKMSSYGSYVAALHVLHSIQAGGGGWRGHDSGTEKWTQTRCSEQHLNISCSTKSCTDAWRAGFSLVNGELPNLHGPPGLFSNADMLWLPCFGQCFGRRPPLLACLSYKHIGIAVWIALHAICAQGNVML